MFLSEIIKQVNKLVSNSSSYRLSYDQLEFYLERTVDHINQTLLTNFRTPKEFFEDGLVYYNLFKTEDNFIGIIYSEPKESGNIYFNNKDHKLYIDNQEVVLPSTEEFCYYVIDLNLKVVWDGSELSWESADTLSDLDTTISELGPNFFDYNEIPDRYIRSCIIYYAAALYLEEEDEFESQYNTYLNKAESELADWRKQYFSCYDAKW